jgi:hypothetical protein
MKFIMQDEKWNFVSGYVQQSHVPIAHIRNHKRYYSDAPAFGSSALAMGMSSLNQ